MPIVAGDDAGGIGRGVGHGIDGVAAEFVRSVPADAEDITAILDDAAQIHVAVGPTVITATAQLNFGSSREMSCSSVTAAASREASGTSSRAAVQAMRVRLMSCAWGIFFRSRWVTCAGPGGRPHQRGPIKEKR